MPTSFKIAVVVFIFIIFSLNGMGCSQCLDDGHEYWLCHDRGILYMIAN